MYLEAGTYVCTYGVNKYSYVTNTIKGLVDVLLKLPIMLTANYSEFKLISYAILFWQINLCSVVMQNLI